MSAGFVRLTTLVEACVWGVGVLLTGVDTSPLLPYLLAPAFAGGLLLGLDGILVPVGSAAVAVLAGSPVLAASDTFATIVQAAGEWVTLSLIVGLLGSWVRHLQQNQGQLGGYLQAYRLLGQLRAVARRLPAGLDRVAVADGLLREIRAAIPGALGGTVLVRAHGDRLIVLSSWGDGPADHAVDIKSDASYGEAWSAQRPILDKDVAVLPLIAGDRTSGLLVLALAGASTVSQADLTEAFELVRDGALRLETALLFDELREVATVEERRRLAREIHDGVAQDLAAFGYQLDSLTHEARGGLDGLSLAEELQRVREDLGRLIADLRLSIFELRSDVGASPSLGAALADFARAVGQASGLKVHLTLDEGHQRLPADTEAELLRISQEAITNSRKHAQARNLWIHCQVDPPSALISVEDDGVGSSPARGDSFGIQIMRERAARLRAELVIAPRKPTGTIVTCQLRGR
jgi:signal transduction histidine kinase